MAILLGPADHKTINPCGEININGLALSAMTATAVATYIITIALLCVGVRYLRAIAASLPEEVRLR